MNRKEKKKKKRGLITFLILVVLVVLGVLAVYYQYMKKTAVAGYRAYTDDGDGKTGCKRYGCRISGNSERGY